MRRGFKPRFHEVSSQITSRRQSLRRRNPAQRRTVCAGNPVRSRTLSGSFERSSLDPSARPVCPDLDEHLGVETRVRGARRAGENRSPAGPRRRRARVRARVCEPAFMGVRDPPAVRAPTATPVLDEHQLARAQQRRTRTPIRAIRQPRRPPQLLGRYALNGAVMLGERRHHRQQQPRGPPRRAVRKDQLEQLRVHTALPPRTTQREHQPDHARLPATPTHILDHDHPTGDQPITSSEKHAATQARTRGCRRRARPREML